jgi:hypothetical protein
MSVHDENRFLAKSQKPLQWSTLRNLLFFMVYDFLSIKNMFRSEINFNFFWSETKLSIYTIIYGIYKEKSKINYLGDTSVNQKNWFLLTNFQK